MKKLILAIAALGLATGAAVAQEAPKPPAPHEAPPPPPPPHHAPSKAAHFHIEDKGYAVDVQCAEDQATAECAEIVYKLLEKVGPPKK